MRWKEFLVSFSPKNQGLFLSCRRLKSNAVRGPISQEELAQYFLTRT